MRYAGGAWIVALCILFAALAWMNLNWRGVRVDNDDAEEALIVARSLASGQGNRGLAFCSDVLDFLRQHGLERPPWINMERPLPYVVPIAAWMRVLGPTRLAGQMASLMWFAATLVVLWLLVSRVSGTAAAVLATGGWLLNQEAWYQALNGMSETLLSFFLVGMLACVMRPGRGWAVAGGIIAALAVVHRATLLPCVLVALWLGSRTCDDPVQWRRSRLVLIAAMVFGLAGLGVANKLTTGFWLADARGGNGVREDTRISYPQADSYWPDYIPPTQIALRYPGDLVKKTVVKAVSLANVSVHLNGAEWMTPLFLLGLAPLGDDLRRRRLAVAVLAILVLSILGAAVGSNLIRYVQPVGPLLYAVGAGTLAAVAGLLGEQARGRFWAIAALAVLICSAGWTVGLMLKRGPDVGPAVAQGYSELSPANQVRLAELVPPGTIVSSNVNTSVGWYAQRPATMLPPAPGDLEGFQSRLRLHIGAIYLTPNPVNSSMPATWKDWDDMRARKQPPSGFRLAESFPDGAVLFIREDPPAHSSR